MKLSTLIRSGLLSLLLIATCINAAHAQASTAPISNAQQYFSQLFNPANVYYNVPTANSLASGTLVKDTTSNTTTLTVIAAKLFAGVVNADTFKAVPLSYGSYNLTASALKVTGTDTLTVTPVGSLDGIRWHTLQGVTPQVLYPTSLTVPVGCEFNFPVSNTTNGGNLNRYLGLQFTGNASSMISVQGFINLIKTSP